MSVALFVAGCGHFADSAATGQSSETSQITNYPVASRTVAPDVSGATLDGTQFDLKSLRGKVVVLNVWGSWCPPCRAEMPALQRVYQQEKTKDVQFVGLDTQDTTNNAQAFVKSVSVTYPSIVDPNGDLVLRFSGILPPSATPSTVVIDKEGRIAARAISSVTEADLHAMIDPVLGESA